MTATSLLKADGSGRMLKFCLCGSVALRVLFVLAFNGTSFNATHKKDQPSDEFVIELVVADLPRMVEAMKTPEQTPAEPPMVQPVPEKIEIALPVPVIKPDPFVPNWKLSLAIPVVCSRVREFLCRTRWESLLRGAPSNAHPFSAPNATKPPKSF